MRPPGNQISHLSAGCCGHRRQIENLGGFESEQQMINSDNIVASLQILFGFLNSKHFGQQRSSTEEKLV